MNTKPIFRAGLILGLGLGGLFDGIVLHQVLGWHHLICTTDTCQPNTVEDLKRQITQDGYFDFSVWLITLTGVVLLFRSARQSPPPEPGPVHTWSGKVLCGAILTGWGAFNFFEGLINHQILGLHHVLPGSRHQLFFDLLFLASGLLLAAVGGAVARSVSAWTTGRR